MNHGETARRSLKLVDRIKPMLAMEGPRVQGAVVAELFAIWLASHSEDLRDDLTAAMLKAIAGLTAVYSEELWGK